MTDDKQKRVPLLARLQNRGVLRVAASYCAIAWLLVQIAGAVAEPFDLPVGFLKWLIVTTVIGFPVAVALAWHFELSSTGIEVDHGEPGDRRPTTSGIRRYADVIIIGALIVVVGVLVARQPEVAALGRRATVAVLPFQYLGGSTEGEVLAQGVAESVLHQLANLQQLDVISRTSSFAFRDHAGDARDIGRQLAADYLLEGSIQIDKSRLRVTTQLIDVRSGADVWSMRFDRVPSDIFDLQDAIALQVVQALAVTLDADATERMKGQGTENLEAYIAFLQARTLLSSDRVSEVAEATRHLERALELDPKFAAAYVALAEAGLFVAQFEVTDDRDARFAAALERGKELVEEALRADDKFGDAFLVRAAITAYPERAADRTAARAAAELDYRQGLQLSPNSARGYLGLAELLYETPSRRDEALELVERARKLDPLQPVYAVTRSVFLFYEKGDIEGADQILSEVLRRHPDYVPGLVRLGELRGAILGRHAEAIELLEHALRLDPNVAVPRRALIRAYLAIDEEKAAEQVADAAEGELSDRRLPLLLYRNDWKRAGEAAYRSLEHGTVSPREAGQVVFAIRMHARATRDFERARVALEAMAGVQWDESNRPVLPARPELREAAIGLADVLLLAGETEAGRALLQAILDRMHRDIDEEGRSERWYREAHPVALMLAGEREAGIAMLQLAARDGHLGEEPRLQLEHEPAYRELHDDPRFIELADDVRRHLREQRAAYARLVAEGRVPDRNAGHEVTQPSSAMATGSTGAI